MTTGLLYKADAEGARILWLLTVQWAGHTIRIADDEVDVETDAGDWLHYEDGLGELAVEEEITLGGDAGGSLSVPLEVAFPALVNVPLLVARGHRLSTARGELARWVEGTPWESRRRVVVGRFVKPIYGSASEPVRTSLDESLSADQAMTHSPGQRVIGANWEHISTIPTEQLGEDYPIVIGRAGFVSTAINADGWITGSSATWVDYRRGIHDNGGGPDGNLVELRAVIAGHHVQAGSVYVNTDDAPGGYRIRVANGFDDQGRAIATIGWWATSSPAGAPEDDYDEAGYNYTFSSGTLYGLGSNSLPTSFNDSAGGHRLYVGWRDEDDLSAGGLVVDGKLVRSAGPLLSFLLGKCGASVDRGAMAAVGPLLSRFNFDGVIEKSTRVWDFLKREILPLLPVSIASGPDGYFVHVWRFDATRADATLFIDTASDPDIERIGGIEEEDSDQVNRIVIRYAYSYRTQAYTAEIVLGAAGDMPSTDTPATVATGSILVSTNAAAGDTFTINGVTVTGVIGAAGPGEFTVDATRAATALRVQIAIATAAALLGVTATIDGTTAYQVNLRASVAGAAGNVSLACTGGRMIASGVALTGGVDAVPNATFRVSPYCQASRDQLGGEVRERVIETAFVYETSTAWAIAEFIAKAYALPARLVQWRLPEGPYIGARRAAVALLSDEETFLEEDLALVTGVVTDGSGWLRVTTRVVDQPGKLYRGA